MLQRSGSQTVPAAQRVSLLHWEPLVWQRRLMSSRREALRRTFSWSGVLRSLKVAAIIGTILNSINQGPEIFTGHWPVWWKLILTYFTPFAVASYGSYAAFRSSK